MVDANAGHIVAMGGGGFSMEPENRLLDDFVLGLSRRQPARVCFLPTASGDSETYIAKFYRAFSSRCTATNLTLIGSPGLPRHPARTSEVPDFVREQDSQLKSESVSIPRTTAIWPPTMICRASAGVRAIRYQPDPFNSQSSCRSTYSWRSHAASSWRSTLVMSSHV